MFRLTAGNFYPLGGNADWMFALVRTNADAPKHPGISFVLLPMDQPGVTEVARRYLGMAGGRVAEPALRQRIIEWKMASRAFALTQQRAGEENRSSAARGKPRRSSNFTALRSRASGRTRWCS